MTKLEASLLNSSSSNNKISNNLQHNKISSSRKISNSSKISNNNKISSSNKDFLLNKVSSSPNYLKLDHHKLCPNKHQFSRSNHHRDQKFSSESLRMERTTARSIWNCLMKLCQSLRETSTASLRVRTS